MKSVSPLEGFSKGETEALYSKEPKNFPRSVQRAKEILQQRCPPSSNVSDQPQSQNLKRLPTSKSTFSFLDKSNKSHTCCTPSLDSTNKPQSDDGDEVEVVSLLEEKVPKYKLRVDTITKFTGYPNEDFVGIPYPVLKDYSPVSPEQAQLTLSYFLISGERVSQMTRAYSDPDALERLLQEKEKDLELAARIGQQLLERNRILEEKVTSLESQCRDDEEQITQLKHDLNFKSQLLELYDDVCDSRESSKAGTPMASGSSVLEKRVTQLEEDNKFLRSEAARLAEDVEKTEAEEKYLVEDAVNKLGETNRRVEQLSTELHKKSEECIAQQEELSMLVDDVKAYEEVNHELVSENAELRKIIDSLKCVQDELSTELMDLKDNYLEVVTILKETQEQLRSAQQQQNDGSDVLTVFNSLAYEIESSVARQRRASEYFRRTFDTMRAINTSMGSSGIYMSSIGSDELPAALETSLTCSDAGLGSSICCPSPGGTSTPSGWKMPEKLQIVKPIEGSTTLSVWSSLATPHLGKLLDKHPGVRTRVENRLNDFHNGKGLYALTDGEGSSESAKSNHAEIVTRVASSLECSKGKNVISSVSNGKECRGDASLSCSSTLAAASSSSSFKDMVVPFGLSVKGVKDGGAERGGGGDCAASSVDRSSTESNIKILARKQNMESSSSNDIYKTSKD